MEDVIYLESDAEITEAIDKLKSVTGDQVKIVVPGRSGLLQSVVNLKLLKRSAESVKKELVLVTNDKTATNLAGAVGLAVASSVKAVPKIPEPKQVDDEPDIVGTDNEAKNPLEQDDQTEESAEAAEKAEASAAESAKSEPEVATNNKPMTNKRSIGDGEAKPKSTKGKSQKKIPDFNALQKRLWIVIGLALFFVVMVIVWIFVPSAIVKLQVDAKKTPINTKFIADTSTTKSDYANQILAAQELTTTKNLSANFNATGKKDVGTKASGSISIQNCDDANQHQLAAGSIVSTAGKNFTTSSAATIPGGTTGGGKVNCSASVSVGITATSVGDSYNFGNTNFTLVGFSSLYKASGSTSGGSSKQVIVVTQSDIDNAKKGMLESQEAKAKEELTAKAGKDVTLIDETFKADVTNFNSSTAVDSEASNGTVTASVKYTMVSINNTELDKMLTEQVKGEVPGNSEIYDNGLKSAKFTFIKELSDTQDQLQISTVAFYGDKLDREKIAKQVAGKSKKDVSDIVRQNQGVAGATVDSWPALLPSMPILSSHIKVEPQVSTQ